jgi:hypothetical protein
MKTILIAVTFGLCLPAMAGGVPASKPAEFPDWWFVRDVIAQINSDPSPVWPEDYPGTRDFALANLGQLKHFATKAYDECQAQLPGGAWSTAEGIALTAAIGDFTQDSNYSVLNVGQLKNIAKLFYDLLNAQSVDVSAITGSNPYPWTATTADDGNYSPANLGQLKYVFSFTIP